MTCLRRFDPRVQASLLATNGQLSDPVSRVLNQHEGSRLQLGSLLIDNRSEARVDGSRPLVRQSKEHYAGPVKNAKGENLPKVEVKRQDDAGITTSALDDFGIRRALHTQGANVRYLVARLKKEQDRGWRNAGVGKKT